MTFMDLPGAGPAVVFERIQQLKADIKHFSELEEKLLEENKIVSKKFCVARSWVNEQLLKDIQTTLMLLKTKEQFITNMSGQS